MHPDIIKMMEQKRKLYLASASPRRHDLLKQIGLDFSVVIAPVQEKMQGPIDCALAELAYQKANTAISHASDGVILAADTIVLCNGQIFGKPKDEQDAFRMLSCLSGGVSQVKTGVCALDGQTGVYQTHVETTDVFFIHMTTDQIWRYIRTGEPYDKAGAYAMQGIGAQFIRKINGCYYNVVGLPITATLKLLRDFGALS